LADDAPGAQALLDRFRTLKTAQIDRDPPDDLRDRIVRDAQVAGVTVDRSVARAARALALSPPAFQPVSEARIPRRIAHYWEGPRTAAIEDGLAAWAEFPQTVHDAASARLWLADHAPGLGGPFDRLSQAAARADLFRIALMAVEGGIFADLDERPRASVAPWLDKARAVLVIEQGHGTIANNFLAGEPGLALFAQARDRIVSRLAQVETPYPWWDCGPAQMTLALWPHRAEAGLRLLSQADYDARVATNLPYPHKRGPGHWR
ncbi:MAG: hypothetical protein KDK22_13965, partial [Rhodobacteraceae bacterium]|nr:hypothetical protein [Paracoccaceae bacterium]